MHLSGAFSQIRVVEVLLGLVRSAGAQNLCTKGGLVSEQVCVERSVKGILLPSLDFPHEKFQRIKKDKV